MFRFFVLLLPLALAFGCGGNAEPERGSMPPGALGPLRTIEMEINGVPVAIEVAITPAEQAQGLMYRESMDENRGMLFVYEEPRYMSFWMKNTRIPLSIAFIRDDGVIGNIEDMEPQRGSIVPSGRYTSKYRSLYALEMNRGWFERNGVGPGDRIDIPTDAIEALKRERSPQLGR